MMMKVSIPVEQGNRGIKEGLLPKTIMGFIEQNRPEACYFTAQNGDRTGIFIFDFKDPTMMPTIAEPFFTNLNAKIEFTPVMNLEDLKAGLDKLTKR